MSDTIKRPVRDAYDKFTESCPKMTRRFKRELLAELAAWMLLQRVRIERQKLHADQAAQAGGSDELKSASAKLAVRMSVIDDMVRQLPDKWSEYLWWECAQLTEDLFGPAPKKPVHVPTIPPVNDVATGRSDTGSDLPAGARKNQRGRRNIRPAADSQ